MGMRETGEGTEMGCVWHVIKTWSDHDRLRSRSSITLLCACHSCPLSVCHGSWPPSEHGLRDPSPVPQPGERWFLCSLKASLVAVGALAAFCSVVVVACSTIYLPS